MVSALFLAVTAMTASVSVPRIILDTDMIHDYDDVGAMAVLHTLADRGQCELLATVTSSLADYSVPSIEIFNRFYGRPDLPVGAPTRPAVTADPETSGHRKFKWLADRYRGWYRHAKSSDAPDAVEVYRKVLEGQPDKSVTICSIGYFTNLRRLMERCPDLVRRKVKILCADGFMFPNGCEYNVYMDPESARYLLANWPTEIVMIGWDYGCGVYSGRVVSELPGEGNPVKDLYRHVMISREEAQRKGDFFDDPEGMGHCSYDQMVVMASVFDENSPYFGLERGVIRLQHDPEGRGWIRKTPTVDFRPSFNTWTPTSDGRHRRMVPTMNKRGVGWVLEELISAGPLLSKTGVVCLVFDLTDSARPDETLALLKRHRAHATFFIHGIIDAERLALMKSLREEGHSVGLGTVSDGVVPAPFAMGKDIEWCMRELDPQIEACRTAAFPVRAMAFPKGIGDPESEITLAVKYGFLRLLRRAPYPSLGFVKVATRRQDKTMFATAGEMALPAIEKSAAENLIVTLYAADVDSLSSLLDKANELGVKALGLDELD